MRTRFLIALPCIPALSLVTSVGHADVVASHTQTSPFSGTFNSGAGMAEDDGIIYDNRQAQSFITNASGTLSTISFIAAKSSFSPTTADLRVSLTTFASGQPGTTLASRLVSLSTFEDSIASYDEFSHAIDFSASAIMLEADTQYALVFSSDTANANYRLYGNSEGYLQGANYFSQNGSAFSVRTGDLFFQVETGIPTPSTAALLALAGLTATRRKR